MKNKWNFIEQSFNSGMNGSTFSKLMENRSTIPTLIAREIVQNSQDANERLISETKKMGLIKPGESIDFRMEFNFVSFNGAEKENLLRELGLQDLFQRANLLGSKVLGRQTQADFSGILKDKPLELLVISDFGGRGLVGSLDNYQSSAWYNCLLAVGNSEDKGEQAGGSYGFGKSAFVQGSSVPCVFAYTKTMELPDDKANRRFGGVTYWSSFSEDGKRFTGIGHFGDSDPKMQLAGEFSKPFENEKADYYAKLLSLSPRGDKLEELGTTLVIVAPKTEPEDLIEALELSWWPALEGIKPLMKLTVTDYQGTRRNVSPKQNPSLSGFRRAYGLATSTESPIDGEFLKKISGLKNSESFGKFGAFADVETCFIKNLPNEKGSVRSRVSQIALMRSPRMVIEYFEVAKGEPPFIDCVFIAAPPNETPQLEDILRASEPATHDYWWPKRREEQSHYKKTNKTSAEVTFHIRDEIRKAVNEFRNLLKPIAVENKTILSNFGQILGKLFNTSGAGVPEGEYTPVSINFLSDPSPNQSKKGISYVSKVKVSIKDDSLDDMYEVTVNWKYFTVEDEDSNGDALSFTIKDVDSSSAFEITEHGLLGHLSRGQTVIFSVESEYVSDGVSVKAIPSVSTKAVKSSENANA